MPVKASDFILSAHYIMSNSMLSEIDYRNAVSRAYYAAYHEAKRIADNYSRGNDNNAKGLHDKIIRKLLTHPNHSSHDKKINQIGNLLALCKIDRVKADYHLSDTINKINAATAILNCQDIINLTSQFP